MSKRNQKITSKQKSNMIIKLATIYDIRNKYNVESEVVNVDDIVKLYFDNKKISICVDGFDYAEVNLGVINMLLTTVLAGVTFGKYDITVKNITNDNVSNSYDFFQKIINKIDKFIDKYEAELKNKNDIKWNNMTKPMRVSLRDLVQENARN